MGGVDAALADGGQLIPTPLAPNLWRTDFATGASKFVFWQFMPLKISLVAPGGAETVLCAQNDVAARDACTAIADTGYGEAVVGDAAARAAARAATDPQGGAGGCAEKLRVRLPTGKGGKDPVTLDIPLSTGGDCATLTVRKDDWVPPPQKLVDVLPPNWFVFGQPLLRQLYVAFSFEAYGDGGLFFARRAAP